MPKLKCVCGNIILLGDIPSPNQFMLISDVELDEFHGFVDVEEIYKAMKVVAHCSKCERLHVFWNGFDQLQTIYMKN